MSEPTNTTPLWKPSWIENAAGILPALMMCFLLSSMFILDAREDRYIGSHLYLSLIQKNASSVRAMTPAILLVVFAFSALNIVKNWRAFAIFPTYLEDKLGRAHFFWPFALLYISYFGTIIAYGHYVWLHEACFPRETFDIIVNRATCTVDANRFLDAMTFSVDQFSRGLWGDFWELIGPSDPAHSVQKDTTFILVTGFYRLLVQTALFVLPASFLTGARLLFRRRKA